MKCVKHEECHNEATHRITFDNGLNYKGSIYVCEKHLDSYIGYLIAIKWHYDYGKIKDSKERVIFT